MFSCVIDVIEERLQAQDTKPCCKIPVKQFMNYPLPLYMFILVLLTVYDEDMFKDF